MLVPHYDYPAMRARGLTSMADAFEGAGMRSALAVALRVRGQTIGALALVRFAPGSEPFCERDVRLAQAIADHAALAITNARLLRSALNELADRERAEEALKKTEAHLRQAQKMEAVGRLASGIAHDFNNIIMAIAGNTELAMRDLPLNHPAHARLREVDAASKRAADLVRGILAFSRRPDTQASPMSLAPVVDEALRLLRLALPAGVALKRRFDDGVPDVVAHPTQVHQVVMNLVTNAIDALRGRELGEIEVRLDEHTEPPGTPRHVPILQPGRYAVLTVRDNGCGMDEATGRAIFDPFFTTKPLGNGTGLGLSLVDGIARNSGGAVHVESRVGEGATFHVYLPASAMHASVVEQAPRHAASVQSGQSVLYVDDDRGIALLANAMITSLGYASTVCTEPELALAMVKENPHKFSAILMDLSMPGMTGLELAKAMLEARADLPIVLISANVSDEDAELGRTFGVREVLLKPYNLGALSDVLGRATHREPKG
ncbi:MAG: hypothetical protein RL385_2977 [Pseudomonadota bacterium]